MGKSILQRRKLASACLGLAATLVGTLPSARGGDRWWEKNVGIGFRWNSAFYSRGYLAKSTPNLPIDAAFPYLGGA
ncbi:MAG: hypothetical protein ONB23_02095 [candidate division KSB1 bacterium]|nr:hypothetical protein [candidate division KSB1 bacterium]